jgi:UDP-N-acetylglucosamine 2-epimerase (non-hydrolysing)
MKVCIVYGTRPEYLKVYPLLKKTVCTTIRILQHADILEEDMQCDSVVYLEDVNKNRLDSLGSQILQKLTVLIEPVTHVIVQGDTATAFYSALCAFQNNKKVIHLEAGMRTYDLLNPYPEEGYRQMISRISSIHLCPHEANAELLQREHVSGKIHVVGNTILDLVKSYDLQVSQENTVLITFHRRENLQYLEYFINQLNKLVIEHPDKKFIWIMHPNKDLQQQIRDFHPLCMFIQPCSHREFLEHVKSCFCILTDSGGIQEECAFLGKTSIVLRQKTERDQIKEPYLFVSPPPYDTLKNIFNHLPKTNLESCFVYGDGNSCELITQILNEEQCA